jgi:hypothetical protein
VYMARLLYAAFELCNVRLSNPEETTTSQVL